MYVPYSNSRKIETYRNLNEYCDDRANRAYLATYLRAHRDEYRLFEDPHRWAATQLQRYGFEGK